MAKFCTKCGAPLNENAAFCTNCGAPQDSKNSGSVTADAADAVTNAFNNVKDTFSSEGIKNMKANPEKKALIVLGCAVLAVIIVIVLLISLIFGGGYKTPIDNYFEGIEDANVKKILKSMPECQVEYIEDKLDEYDSFDTISEYMEDAIKYAIEEIEDQYGDDFSISYEITNKEELSDKELRSIRKRLRSTYDDDDVKVTKGYEIELLTKIKGDDDSDERDMTIEVAKVDGDWCIVDGGLLPN